MQQQEGIQGQGGNGGKKKQQAALNKAIQNHIDNVLSPQIKANSRMFELEQDGKIKASADHINCIMDGA